MQSDRHPVGDQAGWDDAVAKRDSVALDANRAVSMDAHLDGQ